MRCNTPFADGLELGDAIRVMARAIELTRRPIGDQIQHHEHPVTFFKYPGDPCVFGGGKCADPSDLRNIEAALHVMRLVDAALKPLEYQEPLTLQEMRQTLAKRHRDLEHTRVMAATTPEKYQSTYTARIEKLSGELIPRSEQRIAAASARAQAAHERREKWHRWRGEKVLDAFYVEPDVMRWYAIAGTLPDKTLPDIQL